MLECIDERCGPDILENCAAVRLEGMAHNDPLVVYRAGLAGLRWLLADLRSVSVALMFRPLAAAGLVGTSQASRESRHPGSHT
jgi:hypothetical protein